MPIFTAPIDLNFNELRNAVTQNLPTAPTVNVKPGLRYYDTTDHVEKFWNGTTWVAANDTSGLGDLAYLDQVTSTEIADGTIVDADISPTAAIALSKLATDPLDRANHTGTQLAATISDLGALGTLDQITDAEVSPTAAIQLSKLAVDPLDRANHTGTQLAATISDFDTQVRTNPLNLLAVPTGDIDLGGNLISNAGMPALASDLANKSYVDSVAAGMDPKASVRGATVANIDLSAPPGVVEGVTLNAGDRILVKAQTDATQNGIYDFNGAGSAMTRSSDADSDAEVNSGMYVFVEEGDHASEGWILHTPDPITVGTTPLDFTQFSGAGVVVGTPARIAVTGNQVDIDAAYVGQASLTTLGTVTTGTWNATPIDIAYGGTGATDAAGARANLGISGEPIAANIGDGSAVEFNITHPFNSVDVGVQVYLNSAPYTSVWADVDRTAVDTVKVYGFDAGNPPTADQYRVLIWG